MFLQVGGVMVQLKCTLALSAVKTGPALYHM